MRPLPTPINNEQTYLAAICDKLDRLIQLVDERLPQWVELTATLDTWPPIELREPAEPAAPTVDPEAPKPRRKAGPR